LCKCLEIILQKQGNIFLTLRLHECLVSTSKGSHHEFDQSDFVNNQHGVTAAKRSVDGLGDSFLGHCKHCVRDFSHNIRQSSEIYEVEFC